MRGADNVHKVDVYAAVRLVQHTVDIESEEHQNHQEFQTVGVVLDGKFHFLICEQIKGEYNEKDMIPEVLRGDQPTAVSRRVGGD